MNKTNLKKIIFGLLLGATIFSLASCSSTSKALKAIEGKDGLYAMLETEKGTIALELFYDKTPMTVANFVGLAEGTLDAAEGKPFYDGLKFHRVIENFMIQGGDPEGNGTGGPGYQFPDEFVEGLEFDGPGKLAMANAGPDTNGSQFFITHLHTEWLNKKHTIFGQVVYGQDVVNKVAQGDHIKSLKIIRNGADAEKFVVDQAKFEDLIAKNAEREAAIEAKMVEELKKGCEKDKHGIYYEIQKEGTGKACGVRDDITVEYMGYFADGTIFDATTGYHPNGHEPITFNSGEMIPGFDLMVQEMKLGEKRKIVIPPELAYGPYGVPGAIPPNATVCFEVELVNF